MHDFKKVYIFGYSGHAYVLIESMLALGYTILGYFDKSEAKINPYNIPYCGFELDVHLKLHVQDAYVFPTVGEHIIREKLVHLFTKENLKQFVLIDQSAQISKTAAIGMSTYIGKNAVVNAISTLGVGVIINTNAVVEHECEVHDFVHLAPSSTIAGNVKIGKSSFLGANSVCKQNTTIGANCVLGAGSVVLKNIPDGETWVGNPAKKIRK